MNHRLQTILLQTTASTFENMGYLLPLHEIDEDQLLAKRAISVSVDFHGPVNGMFVMHTYGQWLPMLTANMMGEEESPSEKLQQDAIGEIANIICGNILESLGDPDAKYQLDSPRFLDPKETASSLTVPTACQIEMGVEDGRIKVLIILTTGTIH